MNTDIDSYDVAEMVFPQRMELYLEAAYSVLTTRGDTELAEIVRIAKPELDACAYHDNWNGGIDYHDLKLQIPIELFSRMIDRVAEMGPKIKEAINIVSSELKDEVIREVEIVPILQESPNWRGDVALSVPVRGDDHVWEKGMYRVFVSHISEFKNDAIALKKEMKVLGVSAFVAHEDIEPTSEWIGEIEYALRTAQGFVALLDNGYLESNWMDQEIGFAYARGVKVVSVLRGEVPHGFIGRFQGLKMHSKNLGWEVCKKLRVFQSEAELYVRAVESVQSYDDAVVLAKIQCCLEPLSQDYVDRIVCAAEVNPVLRESVAFWKRTRHSMGMDYYIYEWLHCKYKYDFKQRKYLRDNK